MDDPIQALIRENPTPAVVKATAVAGYAAGTDYLTPEDPTDRDSKSCLFVRVTDTALVTDHKATATFALADFADDVPGATEVVIAGTTWTVQACRRRFWQGVQNGWTLELV